ncbi:MAG: S-methyl-5-thioribose-1-phosphate isomerase [Deltaproteobacteria bacterium]|nr:S-methyl-5-thioribose-1-phosphate isomerase [Deltaproteobacteria bacterium]
MARTIYWDHDSVVLIDQNKLPMEETYRICRHYKEVIAAINDLTIRGAPAIGVAAAMGIALGMSGFSADTPQELTELFNGMCAEFSRTRPTAVNLFWAIERMTRCFHDVLPRGADHVKKALIEESVRIGEEDIAINRRIGIHGRSLIKDGDGILTHCNAGALATAGYGTALGVIRAARDQGKRIHVYVDETRPVLQGARLTSWEMMNEAIPATLITDNMAGFVMKQGKIDLVIVGADRISANGDAANKIGTYSLSVLAGAHGIPFYIAAPLSTVDLKVPDGSGIPIEERDHREVVCFGGVRTAPEGVTVYNPAFDVTPNQYITAIITEAGIAVPPYGESIPMLFTKETR